MATGEENQRSQFEFISKSVYDKVNLALEGWYWPPGMCDRFENDVHQYLCHRADQSEWELFEKVSFCWGLSTNLDDKMKEVCELLPEHFMYKVNRRSTYNFSIGRHVLKLVRNLSFHLDLFPEAPAVLRKVFPQIFNVCCAFAYIYLPNEPIAQNYLRDRPLTPLKWTVGVSLPNFDVMLLKVYPSHTILKLKEEIVGLASSPFKDTQTFNVWYSKGVVLKEYLQIGAIKNANGMIFVVSKKREPDISDALKHKTKRPRQTCEIGRCGSEAEGGEDDLLSASVEEIDS